MAVATKPVDVEPRREVERAREPARERYERSQARSEPPRTQEEGKGERFDRYA